MNNMLVFMASAGFVFLAFGGGLMLFNRSGKSGTETMYGLGTLLGCIGLCMLVITGMFAGYMVTAHGFCGLK